MFGQLRVIVPMNYSQLLYNAVYILQKIAMHLKILYVYLFPFSTVVKSIRTNILERGLDCNLFIRRSAKHVSKNIIDKTRTSWKVTTSTNIEPCISKLAWKTSRRQNCIYGFRQLVWLAYTLFLLVAMVLQKFLGEKRRLKMSGIHGKSQNSLYVPFVLQFLEFSS